MNFGMILTVSGVVTKKEEKVFEGKTKRTLKVSTLGGSVSVQVPTSDEFKAVPEDGQPVVLTLQVTDLEAADYGKKEIGGLKFMRAEAPRLAAGDPSQRRAA
ncbi:MAG: hypothetical protein C0483_03420 [Pirellula sp.]|nr:hypothetical protein [Pirellula sp.]